MENALIISSAEKSTALLTEMLKTAFCETICISRTAGEARRLLLERDFDLVLINSPLSDETGENLAIDIASKDMAQVILLAGSASFDEMSAATENDGVLVVQKPIDKPLFWAALKLARAAISRIKKVLNENQKLIQKIEDIKIINRAKFILVSHLKMNEQEAHRFIEKQAMDIREPRAEIAKNILKMYDC